MRAMLLILAQDLRRRSKDSTLLVFAIVLPLGMAFMFDLVIGGSEGPVAARYGAVGASPFPSSPALPPVVPVASEQEARELVERGRLDAVFVTGPGSIHVIGSVDAPIAVQVAREIAESAALPLPGPPPIEIVEDATAATRELDPATHYAAGSAVFFMFFAVLFGFTGLYAERSSGTLARLLAAPVPRASVAAGKLLSGLLAALAGMAVLVGATSLLMGARWGHPAGVAALCVACVLAAMGLSAFVASFARTAEQAATWQSVMATAFGLLGGSFFPVGSWFVQLTPHHWFLRGLADLHGGASPLPSLAVLLGVAALTLPFAARLVRA
ncbi:ABC transporter permease [Nonomuraea dietziae]|uniref:ABC-2 type transport system permease protein n=1 Tax=Nonomuraea dietziae TaxID=65515 RepID=A0A7W5YBD7_9ACTN|nr:ABC transporter permease [Nonomuraea dietziae]MBB3731256.1 ABC-2 type transport system permease protein [Nonomuraea dietziae]